MLLNTMKTTSILLLLLTVLPQGCATAPKKAAPSDSFATAESAQAPREAIRTVQLEPSTTAGQTTWRIEQESSWSQQFEISDEQTSPLIKQRLRHALDLAQRGAVHSAQAELNAVLKMCAMELDEAESSLVHQKALSQAFTALEEANDFYVESPNRVNPLSMAEIALAHSTGEFFPDFTHRFDATSAVRAYYEFAEVRLAFACGSKTAASMALYGLGQIEPLLDSSTPNVSARSALFLRTALAVDGNNGQAANELGCLLVRHGNLEEAELVFRRAAENGQCPASIQRNLAVVSNKLAGAKPAIAALPGATPGQRNLEQASLNVVSEESSLGLH